MTSAFIIEGLDRLGKSTLIQNIQHKLGFHQVIHYSKPLKLDAYSGDLRKYQFESFKMMFRMLENANEHARFIFDRAHLGEAVYSPMYRHYDGDYVFDLEDIFKVNERDDIKLILLYEDFTKSKHFVDDGESLGPESARAEEQELFIKAFNKSLFKHKKIVNVTSSEGRFKRPEMILFEALQ